MSASELPFRQVHLDFHTSEQIPRVAAEFDPDEFADTLVAARVNSINVFARCWHGWLYYDSREFPEDVHPNLARRDLLPEMIEACHARGIRAPVYVAVQVGQATAESHPEWCQMSADGRLSEKGPYEPGFRRRLCLNTPFADCLLRQVQEILETMPVDGFWFDGVSAQDCSCRCCRADALAAGLDPSDVDARKRFGMAAAHRFVEQMSGLVRAAVPDALLFYNAGHVGPRYRMIADAQTHLEIESIPSGWGYLHFPAVARYARAWGRQTVGMTGKFHTGWGDFHSYKNRAALEYECFQMLALGSKCCVGDQLHPRGKLCAHTYDLIGSVYAQVEEKEPWCAGAQPVTEVAVFTPEKALPEREHENVPPPVLGATRMLHELAAQFDVVDAESDLSPYAVVILPDEVRVSPELAARLDAFVQAGGALIATGSSGLAGEGGGAALSCLGVRRVGDAPYSPDFIVPGEALAEGMATTEHVMYLRGQQVEPLPGTEVLAQCMRPYFQRSWRHFCSHRHAPSAGEAACPAVTRRGRAIYFSHPVFQTYYEQNPLWCKTLVRNAMGLLLPEPLLMHDGPSSLIATVTEQAGESRWVVHLLHYIPEGWGTPFDKIEDVIPLHDLCVSLRCERTMAAVRLVPQGEAVAFDVRGGRAAFTVGRLEGHQMVELQFA